MKNNSLLKHMPCELDKYSEIMREKDMKAKTLIVSASTVAAGIGFTPIPCADAALLIPLQITMIGSLASIYEVKNQFLNQSALPFVARSVGMIAAGSLGKLVPFLGSVINGTVGATLTGIMGLYVRKIFRAAAIAKLKGEPAPELILDFDLFTEFWRNLKKGGKIK